MIAGICMGGHEHHGTKEGRQGETPPEGEVTLPVDEARPLSAQALEPGGDELEGRGQWMTVAGGAGADTFNVVSSIDPEEEKWR